MSLQEICDIIILIAAALTAIVTIFKFFGKPVTFLKKKKDKEYEENLKKTLDEIIPNYLMQHDIQTRERYLKDREKYLQEIKQSVLDDTKGILEEIKEINIEQSENLRILNEGSKDILRQKIMSIYHKNKDNMEISFYDKEVLDELYKDYKAQGGNSYIDKYYNRMSRWKVLNEELKK